MLKITIECSEQIQQILSLVLNSVQVDMKSSDGITSDAGDVDLESTKEQGQVVTDDQLPDDYLESDIKILLIKYKDQTGSMEKPLEFLGGWAGKDSKKASDIPVGQRKAALDALKSLVECE